MSVKINRKPQTPAKPNTLSEEKINLKGNIPLDVLLHFVSFLHAPWKQDCYEVMC